GKPVESLLGTLLPVSYSGEPQDDRAEARVDTEIPTFGARRKARELAKEVEELRGHLDRLGAFSTIELEQRRDALESQIETQRAQLEERQKEAELQLIQQAEEAKSSLQQELASAGRERDELTQRLTELREEVVTTEETALLQEAGVYEYRHPLSDSVEYKDALKGLRE